MATFVVRLVAAGKGKVRGQIEHVRTGEKTSFSSGDELLSFLRKLNATDGLLVMEMEDTDGAGSDPLIEPIRGARKGGTRERSRHR